MSSKQTAAFVVLLESTSTSNRGRESARQAYVKIVTFAPLIQRWSMCWDSKSALDVNKALFVGACRPKVNE